MVEEVEHQLPVKTLLLLQETEALALVFLLLVRL
jgi:hypothetical protein